ncbi:MFS transporter [Amycolatopsis palatopharyngis]|uniref:MFS transporter n=1 Tax=Amycolatopsis palatopharyngis TaxID=187982 RepID=UPI000E2521E6|nr:MFS transporter [Amycolatopsis palatopharyngis]
MVVPDPHPARFREVLAVGEFRSLFAAQLVTVVGDQLARVALSILVFDRTGSPGWAATVYAATFLPDLLGGPLLSGLADRYPRRTVLVVSDLARVVLVGLMAVPGMPLPLVGALLVGVQLLNPPWNAARTALLTHVVSGRQFVSAMGLLSMVVQSGQVVGFAGGGVLVAWLGPSGALAADAASFGVSALLLLTGLRPRAAAAPSTGSSTGDGAWWRLVRAGVRLVWSDRRLRSLVALGCVSGFYIAGEALAAPYAAELGGGSVTVGLLLGAFATGSVLGMALLARVPEVYRRRLLTPLPVLACAVLLGCAPDPGLAVTLLLFTISGVASAYNLVTSTVFVQLTPDAQRAQAFGLAITALRVSQGAGVVLAGLVAERLAPHLVIATAGALGTVAATAAAGAWHRAALAPGPDSTSGPATGGAGQS